MFKQAAYQSGTLPPTNKEKHWFDTNTGVSRMKYWDPALKAWTLLKPSNIYVVKITQTSTDAPTLVEVVNETGGTPVASYVGVGNYLITLANAFPAAKTLVTIGPTITPLLHQVTAKSNGTGNAIEINVAVISSQAAINAKLTDCLMKVEVFI